MYCWKQLRPITHESAGPIEYPDCTWLVQFSLLTSVPLLTLYMVKQGRRKPFACATQYLSDTGVICFDRLYTQIRVSLRQAFPDELLHGYSNVIDAPQAGVF